MNTLHRQWEQVDRAITAEVAQAQEQGRQAHTGGLIWGAGVLVQEMAKAEGLTGPEVEALLTELWGRPVYVNRYRLAGNRPQWVAEDHNGRCIYLNFSWIGSQTVFTADGGTTWAAIAQRNGAGSFNTLPTPNATCPKPEMRV